jgi:hypothetical protein
MNEDSVLVAVNGSSARFRADVRQVEEDVLLSEDNLSGRGGPDGLCQPTPGRYGKEEGELGGRGEVHGQALNENACMYRRQYVWPHRSSSSAVNQSYLVGSHGRCLSEH